MSISKSFFIILLCILCAMNIPVLAQLQLNNNGAIIKNTSNTHLRIEQGSILNTGTIDNDANLYLDANYMQTGAGNYIGSSLSWLWFEGNTLQQINAAAIPKLRVDNGNQLSLLSNLMVSNQVDLMNNGSVLLNSFNLLIPTGASITNYDINHYIRTNSTGYLQQEVGAIAVIFPVGNSSYNPLTINNTGSIDNFRLRLLDEVYDAGTSGAIKTERVVDRTWLLDEETAGGSVANLTVEWAQSEELLSFDRNNCGIAHWNGSDWDHPATHTAAANMGGMRWAQTKSGQTTFSPFAVEDLTEILPVELLNFDAERLSIELVRLDWTTVSETNNLGFDLERMLEHETEFQRIAFVSGNGNSFATNNYSFNDENAYANFSYYRLKQIDINGDFVYSNIRAVAGHSKSNVQDVLLFPNPSEDKIHLLLNSLTYENQAITLYLYDMRGALIKSWDDSINVASTCSFGISDLPSGAYNLRLDHNNKSSTLRFIRK